MKAEWLPRGPNSRFVVTNLSLDAQQVYEFYTERGGTCEVRIDEFKNGLKADRLSCHRFMANQIRFFLYMAAYWVVLRLREALAKAELASMQIQQLRLRLIKIGGQVIQSARRCGSGLQAVVPGKTLRPCSPAASGRFLLIGIAVNPPNSSSRGVACPESVKIVPADKCHAKNLLANFKSSLPAHHCTRPSLSLSTRISLIKNL